MADEHLVADVLEQHYEVWFFVIPLVQWLAVGRIAEQLLANARKGFELAFYKRELIYRLAEGRRQAEDAEQVKTRFLANAAHDLRQPVTALTIYVDHLIEVPADQPMVLPKIALATATVNRLFDSLFDLARIDDGQLKLQREHLSISEVMADFWEQFDPNANAKGVVMKLHTARVELTTDPVLVRRMLGNVVSNAIKYTPPGKKSSCLRGCVVPVHLLKCWISGWAFIQKNFASCSRSFTGRPAQLNADGHGLGLPILARLANALNTRLSVRSEPGRGTVFRLQIRSLVDSPARSRISANV